MNGEYELTMPFLPVASAGGPFDDTSYAAGWEMGRLAARLEAAKALGLGCPSAIIRRANVAQADLVAMGVGAKLVDATEDGDLEDWALDDWALVGFRWLDADVEDDT